MDVFSLLQAAEREGASDLHLVAYAPPVVRVDGRLRPMADLPPLTPDDIDRALAKITTERQRGAFEQCLELDFGFSLPEIGRLRCNAARQQGSTSLAIRLLPHTVPTLEELGLPQICSELVLRPRGMVVVTGPTGSGKSTTLAAMINFLNEQRHRRIVTIEDPVEYVYPRLKCTISQREVGDDTLSFADALKHVVRQDPDVILVGEMRDLETAAAALSVAETGHLVLTTGHAPSAYQAIERIVDLFPPHERPMSQARLASLLVGVLCQTLVPRADGAGRVPAVEVMLGTAAVRNLIREGKIHQLPNLIRTNGRQGMKLLDEALLDLYRDRLITRESVFAFCNDPDQVAKLIGADRMS